MINLNNDYFINVDNLTSVVYQKEHDRIIFNFNYPTTIKSKDKIKQCSNYLYYTNASSKIDLENFLNNLRNDTNFIEYNNKFINKRNVAFVKLEDERKRIIINLNTNVSYHVKNDTSANTQLISDFIYIDCDNLQKYETYKNELLNN